MSCINLNIDWRVEASTEALKHHTLHVHQMVSAMAHEFQLSQQHMHNIVQSLAPSLPKLTHTLPTLMNTHQLPRPIEVFPFGGGGRGTPLYFLHTPVIMTY